MATRAKIVKAAEIMFGKKGYYGTTINAIASKAKVAPGTLYLYFSDKFTLYCYLLNQYNHYIREMIARRITAANCTNRRDMERMGILAFLEIIREKPYMYNIIWESLYIDKNLFVEYYETFAQHYVRNLGNAQKAGEISAEIDTTVLAYMLMGINNFIGLKYVMFNRDSDLEKIVDEAMRILDEGLFKPTPKT